MSSALPQRVTRSRHSARLRELQQAEQHRHAEPSDADTLTDASSESTELETSETSETESTEFAPEGSPFVFKGHEKSSIHAYLTAHHVFGDYVRKHEIPRKVLHSSIGFITLYLYTQGIQTSVFPVYFHTAFITIFTLDLVRFNSKRFNYAYCQVVGLLMREKEIHGFNGVIWYILGIDFSFTLFSKDLALLSVLLLSWSDTAASTCGRTWGHLTPKIARNKSLAGSFAAFCVGVLSSYLLYGYFIPQYQQYNAPGAIFWTPETSYLNLHTMSILAGFVTALSEGIDLFNWDDNFTIPVLSSIFFYIVIFVFHK